MRWTKREQGAQMSRRSSLGSRARAQRVRKIDNARAGAGAHLVLHKARQRQVIEEIGKIGPHRWAGVLSQAFVIEPVHLCDLPRLVVAAKDGNPLWMAHLFVAARHAPRGTNVRMRSKCR